MKYIKVRRLHASPDDPVLLYSELDAELWEIRKIEVYADGSMVRVDRDEPSGDTMLSNEPLPTLKEITADPAFKLADISADEFETVWDGPGSAHRPAPPNTRDPTRQPRR